VQVLNYSGEELLAGALVEVKADLIGHQQVVLLYQLLQNITHSLRVVQEYQALEWVGEKIGERYQAPADEKIFKICVFRATIVHSTNQYTQLLYNRKHTNTTTKMTRLSRAEKL